VVSEHLKQAIQNKGISPPISIIDNIIETKSIKEQQNKERFTFLMVADLVDKTKNISGVIRAFSKVLLEKPNYLLKIIGDGSDQQLLQDLVAELNISDKVRFLGRLPQNEVLKHYSKVDFLIVNSNYETYSMVTVEAILSGVPVIATKCKGPEQFINENNGILIGLKNTNALVTAMKTMIEKQFVPTEVVNSIENRFSKNEISKVLFNFYVKIQK